MRNIIATACALLWALPAMASAEASHAQSSTPVINVVGVDHVGINVPDMEQAVTFFQNTFGFEPVTEIKDPPVDAGFKKLFDVHASSSVKSIKMLRAGDGANIELFKFDAPDADHAQPHYDDAAAAHIGFYVDDINQAVGQLRKAGVTVLTDPIVVNAGETAGDSWVYFLTPWGAKLELVSYPSGQAGERAAGVHLWRAQSVLSPTSGKSLDPQAVRTLVQGYVGMLNDTDAASRKKFLDAHYTDNTIFNDPEGLAVGRDELNELLGKLQARNRGWTFKVIGEPQIQHGNFRIQWKYGPASDPEKILGEDIVATQGGRIATTLVFLNKVPQ
ncbi:hypothetical protein C1924_18780 [Stenotrophomonas sp. ESTM1D_MKCIP4_1]|uniref:VOC family protein n=1 Tax=Stenotrophomonas sp. ESTM1D_MKCIP4_1 TaxID=2072414 RepID=UPI000D53DE23|nr:VOC family protein [Stenotrophomonas sp. ESTM1D_MKCIP4_1]AWH55088.1 hypothetical protein C1924_18780 [Stenotrophomonas sp. ESTM1D_MKCIP4_1]